MNAVWRKSTLSTYHMAWKSWKEWCAIHNTSPDNLVDNDDHIILWPMFGSKTDTSTHRQSGWKLCKAEDRNIDPIFWLRKLVSLGKNRRHEAGVECLFISTLGPARPASRTVIGGWIKTILKDAGIDASRGSLKSAVASMSWLEECPIDTILERGNWRSENTFKKLL